MHASIRGGSRLIGSKGVSVSRSNVSFYLGTGGGEELDVRCVVLFTEGLQGEYIGESVSNM